MKKLSLIILWGLLCGMVGCGSNTSTDGDGGTGSSCTETLTTKSEIRALIQSYDTDPPPADAITALQAGCDASTADMDAFTEAFLCSIEATTSFNTDSDIQDDIDNLEHMDSSDISGSCAEINVL